MMFNTVPNKYLLGAVPISNPDPMPTIFKFREILEESVRHNPDLWIDGELNLTAIAEFCKRRGYPVTQPNLHRLVKGQQLPGEKYVLAIHKVFGVPKNLLRGEPVSAELDEVLADYRLSTLLLAKKIEALPRDAYEALARQVDIMYDSQRQLRLTTDSKVTPIDRRRSV